MTVVPHYSRINVNASDFLSTIVVEFLREPVNYMCSCCGH